jgi:MinD superfamily P-loop ATPase
MRIAVASGKGGTGKTTVAVNIAFIENISILDLDVEEPNDYIFLKNIETDYEDKVYRPVPHVLKEKCTACGKCREVCEFNAIIALKDSVVVFPEICHSCGACSYFCPENAIEEAKRKIGRIVSVHGSGNSEPIHLVYGELVVGEASPVPLIQEVKKRVGKDAILDCPPGTSCPMVEGISGSDFVILVTEPTPFGFHDLKLAVNVVDKLGIDYGVVINKYEGTFNEVERFCEKQDIELLGKIPFSVEIAEKYSRGEILHEYRDNFKKIYDNVMSNV